MLDGDETQLRRKIIYDIESCKMDIKYQMDFPQNGDKLFKSDGNMWNVADTTVSHEDWCIYADGYKKAADILVQDVLKTGTKKNFLIYPIIFLYRHHLELRLKDIIRNSGILTGQVPDIPVHHRIGDIWNDCKKIILELQSANEDSSINLDIISRCIGEFQKYDPGAVAFRYPMNKKGETSLSNLKQIDILNFSEIGNKLSNAIDSLSEWVHVLLQHKNE